MLRWLRNKTTELFGGKPRSSQWPKVRAMHLRREPYCQACGRSKDLEVHHILPVHAGGEELSPANLATMCRDCHFAIGHAFDWRAWRPKVREVSDFIRKSEVKKS